jgi:hypothetical protein
MKFYRWITHNLHLKILSLVLAVILWIVAVGIRNPESEVSYRNITIQMQAESDAPAEAGLTVITGRDQSVDITVRGRHKALASISSNDIQAWVDLSGITRSGDFTLPIQILLPNSDLQMISKNPASVSVRLDKVSTLQIPLEYKLTGKIPENFIVESTQLSVDHLNLTGPLGDISLAQKAVAYIDVTNADKSFVTDVPIVLLDARGDPVSSKYIAQDLANVAASVTVKKTKEVPLSVELINKPPEFAEEYFKLTISPETILVSGNAALVDELENIELGTLDIGNVSSTTATDYDIVMPGNITNLSVFSQAKVTLELRDLLVKIIPVENIQLVNIPDGNRALPINTTVDVRIRSASVLVQKITASDLSITVDLKNEARSSGRYEFDAVVAFKNPELRDVGILDHYTVDVEIIAD